LYEVRLYVVQIREEIDKNKLDQGLDLLDEEELRVYHRYQVEFKKVEFLAGRVLLKTQLAHRLGFEPRNIHFGKNEYGKLFLRDHDYKKLNNIYFNLSHADKVIVCAMTTIGDIGVDVEHVCKDHLAIMPRVFNETEMASVHAQQSAEEKYRSFYRLWTRKEAHMKAIGMGFSLSPLSFSVPIQHGQVVHGEWEYYTAQPIEHYMLSTAIQNPLKHDIQYRIEMTDYEQLLMPPNKC